MRPIIFVFSLIIMSSKLASAETIQIDFTSDDSYSVEVAKIDVGDTIDWLPKNEGHNVEFLGGPDFNSLPEKSDLNAFYSVTFNLTGVYLYHCTPHGNMGMLGLVIVGNDFHNLKDIEGIELSRVAKSVLKRLIRIAKSNS
jgi:pseudoazurin|tara:strand:+ start:226 stop:648 length:423 start_codon:yes stop_codon:yes gene_type:complete